MLLQFHTIKEQPQETFRSPFPCMTSCMSGRQVWTGTLMMWLIHNVHTVHLIGGATRMVRPRSCWPDSDHKDGHFWVTSSCLLIVWRSAWLVPSAVWQIVKCVSVQIILNGIILYQLHSCVSSTVTCFVEWVISLHSAKRRQLECAVNLTKVSGTTLDQRH